MKKLMFIFVCSLFTSIFLSCLIISCDKTTDVDNVNSQLKNFQSKLLGNDNLELNNYFKNSDCIAFMKRNSVNLRDILVDSMTMEEFSAKHLKVFLVPIKKNDILIGKLYVFSIKNGTEYRSIYEDWSKTNIERTSGEVTVSTGTGNFIATLAVKKVNNKIKTTIETVASGNDDITSRAAKSESWWQCTTRVYATAKKACSGSSQCDFLCDLCNLGGGCSISMAAASAIVCL